MGFILLKKKNFLIKPYSHNYFDKKFSINLNFKELYHTNSKKNVIRGMHYQKKNGANKFVFCLLGKALDVVIDLRKNSKTFKKIFSIILSGKGDNSLYIPSGCAHGNKCISNYATIVYFNTKVHNKSEDIAYRWDSIDFDWNIKKPILSKKDKDAIPLSIK